MTPRPDYGRAHQRRRHALKPAIATGTVRCARGATCKHAELVNGLIAGGLIAPDADWDLGHDDRNPTRYRGPEHAECNRATKSHQPPRRRPAEQHPGLLPPPGGDPPEGTPPRPLA